MSKLFLITLIIFSSLIIVPLSTKAISVDEFYGDLKEWFSEENNETNSVQVINNVNVSANTGGNTASGGEVIEGKGKTEVHIENVINNKSIEPVNIESDANEVKVESEIKVEDNKAVVEREIENGSEKKEENYQVDLNSEVETPVQPEDLGGTNKGILNNLQNWCSGFVEDLQFLFQKIFNLF